MADFASLSFRHRIELAVYPWRRLETTPWQPLRSALPDARVALVTSGGVYRRNLDQPFRRERGGDVSFRVIPRDTALNELVIGQTSDAFDHGPAERDPNVVFPIEPLNDLVRDGQVGSAAPRHLSFNGSITAPARLVKQTAPEAARLLKADDVDVALFVPVWPMCTQSVGLAAAVFEEHGISTACIALVRSVAERLRPPRALVVPFDFGVPLGAAGDAAQQRRVLGALLALLEEAGPGPILRDYA